MSSTDQGDHPSIYGARDHTHAHRRTSHKPTPAAHSISYMEHELDLKVDNLAQAKDRAQLTATGAMSVVHVALLKEVLNKGKENMRFFSVTLSLVCISLALQIMAGILALIVSHLRSYYAKYKDDLIEDMFENLCCCSVVTNKPSSSRELAKARLTTLSLGEEAVDGNITSVGAKGRQEVDDETGQTRFRCCGCYCGGNRNLSNYEYDILEMYDDWGAEHTEIELLAAESDVQVPYLTELLQEAKIDVQVLEAAKDEISDSEFNTRYLESRKKLEEIKHKKDIFEEAKRKLEISTARGDILMLRSDSVRRNRVLKLASFWQQMINYVFYVVFILNAFITGLGIAQD